MKTIWIKINDYFGYVGISADTINNDLTNSEISDLLGDSAESDIRSLNDANYLTQELYEYMTGKGWRLNFYCRCNDDVDSYAFEK